MRRLGVSNGSPAGRDPTPGAPVPEQQPNRPRRPRHVLAHRAEPRLLALRPSPYQASAGGILPTSGEVPPTGSARGQEDVMARGGMVLLFGGGALLVAAYYFVKDWLDR